MKCNHLIYLAICFVMIQGGFAKARKRTTSCEIPEEVRGNWRAPDFVTKKGKLRLTIEIGASSATLQRKLGDDDSSVEFDCTAGKDGYFLTRSQIPEGFNDLTGEIKALYKLEEHTCFNFDKIDDFLKVNMYSFADKPGSEDASQACSGMGVKETLNTIGFSPADQFSDYHKPE